MSSNLVLVEDFFPANITNKLLTIVKKHNNDLSKPPGFAPDGRAEINLLDNWILTDRTVLDVIAFTNCSETIDFKDKEYFEDYARVFVGEYDWIFYVDPVGTQIENNGIRETDSDYRDRIDAAVLKAFHTYGHRCKNVGLIKGSTPERIEQILDAIKF